VAALFALSWAFLPGFGVVDMLAGWWPDWPRALEGGWGACATFLVAVPFAAVAVTGRTAGGRSQLWVLLAALAVTTAAAKEPELLLFVGLLAVQLGIVGLVGGRSGRVEGAPSRALLVVGLAGVVPWMVFALRMWRANRLGAPVDVSIGIDHFALQGALGVALAALPLVAAFDSRMRPLVATAGLAATYLGLVSLATRNEAGALSPAWAAAAIAWGAALAVAAILDGRIRGAEPVAAAG
jgi:hypothetical protein